jgi:hypothetical protein
MMKKIIYILFIGAITFGCTIDDQVNPNAPSLTDVLSSATQTELNNLVNGILADMRSSHSLWVTSSGTLSRELYLFDADPRNTTDLIGTEGTLSNSAFYTSANWITRYRVIKNCNILLEALPGAVVSDTDKDGYSAFAKTIQAHQFMVLWSAYFDSGVRLDVADPDNFGPLVTDPALVLDEVRSLLDDGLADLATATFGMNLQYGFDGFDTPASFGEFNRALAARAAIYDGDNTGARTALAASFMDINGDLTVGPKMIFSNSGGDVLNDLFKTPDQNGNQIVFSDTWIDEAQVGDTRVTSKAALRTNPTSKSGISAAYETRLYNSATSPIDIIRNEELLLIYAEANIGFNNVEALAGINAVRSEAGLSDLVGTVTIDDVLVERRYSLWGEAHRMVDLRRTGNLNDTYVTLDNIVVDAVPVAQIIFTKFPVPQVETGF